MSKPIYGDTVGGGGGSLKKMPQSDWTQTDETQLDFIKNKPTLGSLAAKDEVAKSDLTEEVQTALDNAKSYTETDPTVPAWAKAETKPSYGPDEVGAIPIAQKGTASGVATLDANGHVPSTQLPSYVDDVIEGYVSEDCTKFYEDEAKAKEIAPETGKIYLDLASLRTYRWSSSVFAEISESLALGETSNTAYYGDKGKTAYDHSQITSGNPHGVTADILGLSDVATSGAYGDLTGTPTNVSQFTNDAGYLTQADAPGSAAAVQSNLTAHINDKNNPHGVTLEQLGLKTETWTFTLEDGRIVTKAVYVG